jgi:hypothetical protein
MAQRQLYLYISAHSLTGTSCPVQEAADVLGQLVYCRFMDAFILALWVHTPLSSRVTPSISECRHSGRAASNDIMFTSRRFKTASNEVRFLESSNIFLRILCRQWHYCRPCTTAPCDQLGSIYTFKFCRHSQFEKFLHVNRVNCNEVTCIYCPISVQWHLGPETPRTTHVIWDTLAKRGIEPRKLQERGYLKPEFEVAAILDNTNLN